MKYETVEGLPGVLIHINPEKISSEQLRDGLKKIIRTYSNNPEFFIKLLYGKENTFYKRVRISSLKVGDSFYYYDDTDMNITPSERELSSKYILTDIDDGEYIINDGIFYSDNDFNYVWVED